MDFLCSDVKNLNRNKDMGVAQSSSGVKTDFESVTKVETLATTNFMEAGTEEVGTSSQPTLRVSTYIETNADIKSFLQKPVLLESGTWSTADAINTNLFNQAIGALLSSVPLWQDKVKGFNLIRGDFMVKLVLNASPFQQGKLLLHYLPNLSDFIEVNDSYSAFKNKNLIQKIQHPHLEVDCRRTSVIMRIPYIAPSAWYSMSQENYDWGTVFVDVFSPLKTGSAAPGSQSTVDYTVYGYWENVELAAPTIPQSSNKIVMRRSGEVPESKENEGPIANGLKKVGKVAGILGGVPVLSNFVKPVEWMANIGASVASVLGWSKPRDLDGQTNVYQQLLRYHGTCDGPDTAFPGGITSLNRLETIDYGSYTNEDEMSLGFLYQIPYYVSAFTWSTTSGVGTSLVSTPISPLYIVQTESDTVNAKVTTYEYHVPFTQMATLFNFWRGSLILTLKFVKTQMHSGRLQVTWYPNSSGYAAPDLTSSSYLKRAIIDVTTEEVVTLELPYLALSDYLRCGYANDPDYISGYLDIQVLNDLRAPESCSQDISVQWFISAGPDFELAAPGTALTGTTPYIPQSDGSILVRRSIEQGQELANQEIGDKNRGHDELFHSARCIGEKLYSIKSLLLRNSVLQGYTGGSFNPSTTNVLAMDPYFIGAWTMNDTTGAKQSSTFVGDIFSLFSSWYAYSRGGVRMTLIDEAGTVPLMSAVTPQQRWAGLQPIAAGLWNNRNQFFANADPLAGGSAYYPAEPCNMTDNGSIAYQHIPYYNRYPFHLNTYYQGTEYDYSNVTKPAASWQLYKPSGNFSAATLFMRSVTDDFQLMFFTGCPPVARTYV